MKNILILTDFTENAAHAALSAIKLSEKLHTDLLLVNVSQVVPVVPDYAGVATAVNTFDFWEKESKTKLNNLAKSLGPLVAKATSPHNKSTIHVECAEGNVGAAVGQIALQKDIELIVMGAREGSKLEHILSGSDTISVIDHARRPVLVVPMNAGIENLTKVVFATDYNEADIEAVHYLVKLARLFNFHLVIVHINLFNDKDILKMVKEEAFLKHIKRLQYPLISFKEITGKEVVHRLNTLRDESGADLLCVTHYKNSFLKRLFKHSITQKALERQKIPLLIFPSEL